MYSFTKKKDHYRSIVRGFSEHNVFNIYWEDVRKIYDFLHIFNVDQFVDL